MCKEMVLANQYENRKLEFNRFKKRSKKTKNDFKDKSGKRYEKYKLTNCDGKKLE